MTFGCEGIDSSLFIRNYDIVNNNIIVHYLDGTHCTIPYTKDKERMILDEMINQATVRMNGYKKYGFEYLKLGISSLVVLKYLSVFYDGDFIDMALYGIAFFQGSIFLLGSMLQINNSDEIDKYKIYLSIRENLEKIQQDEVLSNQKDAFEMIQAYKMVGHKYYPLNINTIDNFSLEEVERIRDNLVEYKQSQEKTQQYVKRKQVNNISEENC